VSPSHRARLRPPRGDGEALLVPPASALLDHLREARRRSAEWAFALGGRPIERVRAEARAEVLALARRWAEAHGLARSDPVGPDAPLVVLGHQPRPFHPGVWMKTFVGAALAEAWEVHLEADGEPVGRLALVRPGPAGGPTRGTVAAPTEGPGAGEAGGPAAPRASLSPDGSCAADPSAVEAAAERLADLARAGWKVRPRALGLTLFFRLCLADVYVHGVGGARYDEATEAWAHRLWGVALPPPVVATCTVCLPLARLGATPADLERARRAVRDWRFNPQRVMPEAERRRPEVARLLEEKRALVRSRPTAAEARRRAFRRIHAINAELAAFVPDGPRRAEAALRRLERELAWNALLADRRYPFWLYEPEALAAVCREALADLAPRRAVR